MALGVCVSTPLWPYPPTHSIVPIIDSSMRIEFLRLREIVGVYAVGICLFTNAKSVATKVCHLADIWTLATGRS